MPFEHMKHAWLDEKWYYEQPKEVNVKPVKKKEVLGIFFCMSKNTSCATEWIMNKISRVMLNFATNQRIENETKKTGSIFLMK